MDICVSFRGCIPSNANTAILSTFFGADTVSEMEPEMGVPPGGSPSGVRQVTFRNVHLELVSPEVMWPPFSAAKSRRSLGAVLDAAFAVRRRGNYSSGCSAFRLYEWHIANAVRRVQGRPVKLPETPLVLAGAFGGPCGPQRCFDTGICL